MVANLSRDMKKYLGKVNAKENMAPLKLTGLFVKKKKGIIFFIDSHSLDIPLPMTFESIEKHFFYVYRVVLYII